MAVRRRCWTMTAFVVIAFSSCVQRGDLRPEGLTCSYQQGAVVVCEEGDMSVRWRNVSERNGAVQTAWQVVALDAFSDDTLYDSRKREQSDSQQCPLPMQVGGHRLFKWHVRVWDGNDEASDWSEWQRVRVVGPQDIEDGSSWIGAIGKAAAHLPAGRWSNSDFKKEEFKAAWRVVDTLSAKSILLRKAFETRRGIVDAVVHVSGLGHYELKINGQRVGEDLFAPLWSEYDKTVYFNTYDVTSLLREGGVNGVCAMLGNGFFNVQRQGRYSKLQTSFGPPQLRMRLEVAYADGSRQVVVSDSTWRWDFSPVTFNSIYGGESYDARQEQPRASQGDYDDRDWRPVVLTEGPAGRLRVQTAPGVRIMEHYPVSRWMSVSPDSLEEASRRTKRTVDPSVMVADMGQNLSGFPEIVVRGRKGDKVTLVVSEDLTPQDVCDQRQTGRQHYYEYTLKGDGEERWHPQFSYYGFRYVQVEGAVRSGMPNPEGKPVLEGLRSCFVYSSAPEQSSFWCDNTLFAATHNLIVKAERSNMQGVLTDCPHREKLGWLEQDHLCGPSLFFNYDMTTYFPKVLRDISDTQKENGFVPTTAPQYVSFGNLFDDSPEWGSTLIIVPMMYYERYGDMALVSRNYGAMRRYLGYLTSRSENGILDFGLGDWYDFGPWRAGFSRNTSVACVATAHYIFDIKEMVRAAEVLGKEADAEEYRSLLEGAVRSFNERFYHADSCYYDTGSQAANSLALFLDLAGENKGRVVESLVSDIERHGNRLTTGDVGNRYLFQTLARNGLDSLLYTMLNHYEVPGYGFQIRQGATTLTEQWDPRQGASKNHFMMGQIDEWLFESVAGIRQQAGSVGMRRLHISPHLFEGLGHVRASVWTLYGKVEVDADRDVITVRLPVGCSAVVTSASGAKTSVGSGVWSISQH